VGLALRVNAATDSGSEEVFENIEERLTGLVDLWLKKADPALPVILTAHASVQGAKYGSERTVMLGADLVLPGSLVRDPRLDYVALGHIHKPQDLNENAIPRSSIRLDRARGFRRGRRRQVLRHCDIARGKTRVEWHRLENIRPFIDRRITLESAEAVTETLKAALSAAEELNGAIVRLTVDYSAVDTLIDEPALRRYTEAAFEFHLVKHPGSKPASACPRPDGQQPQPLELLEQYWRSNHAEELKRKASKKWQKRSSRRNNALDLYFPHFDDAVLSCGGLIWEQTQKGIPVEIWTVCAGDAPPGSPSMLAWHATCNGARIR